MLWNDCSHYIPIGGITLDYRKSEQMSCKMGKLPSKAPLATTAKDGTFKLDTIKGMRIPPIVVADQDGEAHGGHFIPDTLTMNEFERIQLEDGTGWYDGVFELKADIKLKKKE